MVFKLLKSRILHEHPIFYTTGFSFTFFSDFIHPFLLDNAPIQVERGKISAGGKTFTGDQYGSYFVWPLKNSNNASVAVITGTGLKGMKAAFANQYFAGASGFPDYMIFTLEMLNRGVDEVKMAGFYDNEWRLNQ